MDIDPGFTTAESRAIFQGAGRLRVLLEVEAALALSSAEVGLIAPSAAASIAEACTQVELDPETIFRQGWRDGSLVIPLVAALRAAVGPDVASSVHRGATSQDIIDTGMVLQIRSGTLAAERALLTLAGTLAGRVEDHRSTPIRGRTLMQPATVMSFGSKICGWLDAVVADLGELRGARSALPVQLGGLVGDQRDFGDLGPALLDELAKRLGLSRPRTNWHTCRRPVLRVASVLASIARTVTKIAFDLVLLSQGEVGEISMRPGGSSRMAGKRNPIDAIRARAAAQIALTQAAGLLTAPPYEHERAAGSWQAEWALVPLLFHGTLASLEAVVDAVTSMAADRERMAGNRGDSAGEGADRLADPAIDRVLAAYEALLQ